MIKPVLNVMLGTACNKHCAYCMQPRHGNNKKADVDQFLEKFIPYLKAHYPQGLYSIEYWGGEPLLYLNALEKIHKAITAELTIDRSARIVTNGSLASKEFVDFANEYNCLVNLSWHDGMLLDEQLALLLQIRQFYVTSVITHSHLSLAEDHEAWQRLCKLGRYVKWQVYPVHCTDNCHQDEYLTKEDVDQYFAYLKDEVISSQSPFHKYILKHLYQTYVKHEAASIEPKCYGQRSLSIDLYGNRYYCHHIMTNSNIAYNIFDKMPVLRNENITDRFFKTDKCQSCQHLKHCLGNCYLSNAHDVECYWVHSAYDFCQRFLNEI